MAVSLPELGQLTLSFRASGVDPSGITEGRPVLEVLSAVTLEQLEVQAHDDGFATAMVIDAIVRDGARADAVLASMREKTGAFASRTLDGALATSLHELVERPGSVTIRVRPAAPLAVGEVPLRLLMGGIQGLGLEIDAKPGDRTLAETMEQAIELERTSAPDTIRALIGDGRFREASRQLHMLHGKLRHGRLPRRQDAGGARARLRRTPFTRRWAEVDRRARRGARRAHAAARCGTAATTHPRHPRASCRSQGGARPPARAHRLKAHALPHPPDHSPSRWELQLIPELAHL